MDELIGRLVAEVEGDRTAAEKAVGITLDFLAKEGPPDKLESFAAKLPGADALLQKAAGDHAGGMGGVRGAGMPACTLITTNAAPICKNVLILPHTDGGNLRSEVKSSP